jgi:hypothetical protein
MSSTETSTVASSASKPRRHHVEVLQRWADRSRPKPPRITSLGARAATAWHGTLSEMGMVVVSSTIAVGPIGQTLSAEGEPTDEGGKALEGAFPRFADDLMW